MNLLEAIQKYMHEYTWTFTSLSGMKVQYECTEVDKGRQFLMMESVFMTVVHCV